MLQRLLEMLDGLVEPMLVQEGRGQQGMTPPDSISATAKVP